MRASQRLKFTSRDSGERHPSNRAYAQHGTTVQLRFLRYLLELERDAPRKEGIAVHVGL
jgi:hypothetical protein